MWIRQSISNMFWVFLVFIKAHHFQRILRFLSIFRFYSDIREKRQINISTVLTSPYHCACCSGCSANVSLSSPEYLPFPAWIAVERRVLMRNWSSLLTCGGETRGWILTSSLKAPITVSFSWSRQLFILSLRFLSMSGFLICEGEKNNNNGKALRRGTTRRGLIQTHRSVFIYPKLNYLSLFFSTGVFAWVVRHIWSSHVSNRLSALLRPLLRISARL